MRVDYRGVRYELDVFLEDDDRTVLEIELSYASWDTDWLQAIEDVVDFELPASFWPSVKPLPGFRLDDALASFLAGMYEEELTACVQGTITDLAVAVQGATEGGE